MKAYTEEDMKACWDEAFDLFNYESNNPTFEDWLESRNTPKPEPKEELDFPWWLVKEKCGWQKWCDITGGNHYAMKEFGELDKSDTLTCLRSEAEKLGLV